MSGWIEKLRPGRWALLAIGLPLLAAAAVVLALSSGKTAVRGGGSLQGLASPAAQQRLVEASAREMRLSSARARSYRPSRVPGGLAIRNARQQLGARMGLVGAEVQSGGSRLGLRLTGYGYGNTLAFVPRVRPQAAAGQIVYRHPGLTEWWANGPRALEQGFTLSAPPPGRPAGRLTLRLALSGTVHPKLLPGGRAVIFAGSHRALLYDDLRATDARGARLPGRIAVGRRRLLLQISTRTARYPLRIDPSLQTTSTPDAYAQTVLADQPDMYLRLDEGSGSAAHDSSGNTNDGSYASGVDYGTPGALSGTGDTAITMPGSAWWLTQSGDSFPAKDAARTVEFWVRTTDYNALPTFVYGGSSGTAEDQFRVQLQQSGGASQMWLSTNSKGGYGAAQYQISLPRAWWDGSWHMYDVTFDGATAAGFMDGQIAGTFPIATPLATVTPGDGMKMGQLGDGGSIDVDELAVYPTALTPARIDAHWSAGAATEAVCPAAPATPYGQSVVSDAPSVYLRLGDLSSDSADRVAHDSSGQCTSGAPTNGAYMSGVAATQGGIAGDADGAITMPGSAWWLTRSDDALPAGNASRTVEFWVRTTDYNALPTFVYGGSGGSNDQFRVQLEQSGGGSYMWLGNNSSGGYGTAQYQIGLPRAWWDGNWHMYDVTFDGSTAVGYMDGQAVGSFPLATKLATVLPGQGVLMGQLGDGGSIDVDELAVYPTALTPARIDAHWSAGGSSAGACASAPTAPYAQTIVSDSPSLYLRLDEPDANSHQRVAHDSSGKCTSAAPTNAAYMSGVADQPDGALSGDNNAAITMPGSAWWLTRSGENLPAGNAARTVEFWVRTTDYNALPTFVYGGSGGSNDQFRVQLEQSGGGSYMWLGNNSSGGYGTAQYQIGLPRAWWDGNWHMYDVTFDGSTALGYMDGQVVGTFPLPANQQLATVVPGNGMMMGQLGDGGSIDVDELAVYPSALAPKRLAAHFEAQYLTPPGTSLIQGTAVFGGGGGAQGARVQACPSSGRSCVVDPNAVSSSGAFHMLVPDGTYTVTIFPPFGSSSGPVTITGVTVPPNATNLSATFSPPGGLSSNASFSAPDRGTVQDTTPGVNWGEPSTYSITGACKNGLGTLAVGGTNTSTGQFETVPVPLLETPQGSGNYQATIPPLAPMHGLSTENDVISCPGQSGVIPSGGDPAGGNPVLLNAQSGLTGATAVSFGSTPATSFQVFTDNFILVTAPAGTGSVPVTVTASDGSTINIGMYTYLAVSSIGTGSGSAAGGTAVTINGQGFQSGAQVLFGLVPAQLVTYVSPTQLNVIAPANVGAVDVRVVQGTSMSAQNPGAEFVNTGGPAGTSSIDQGSMSQDAYAQQVADACESPGMVTADDALCRAADFSVDVGHELTNDLIDKVRQEALGPVTDFVGHELGTMAAYGVGTLLDKMFADKAIGFAAGALIYNMIPVVGEIWDFYQAASAMIDLGNAACKALVGTDCRWDFWNLFIDPSGTIVDTNGNPINGASATILSQPATGGAFTPVDPSSGVIEPATNPETTGASGTFDWDALAGGYEVQASAPGCTAPGAASQPDVFTAPFTLPPPAIGLLLTLSCPDPPTPPQPTVTAVQPSGGPADGGTTVDIIGTGLAGVTAVHFGSVAATQIEPLSAFAVAAVAPAGTGTSDVTVTTAGGTSATVASDAYSYAPATATSWAPFVTSIAPNSGPLAGGTVVTITGSGLSGTSEVDFGGTASPEVSVVSANKVQAVAPSTQFPGRVDITVSNEAGSSATSVADLYTYGTPPPAVATAAALNATPSQVVLGGRVSFAASVTPTDGGGAITLLDNGTPIAGCSAIALTGSGSTKGVTCGTSALGDGRHTITASYTGDASYGPSITTTPVTVVATPQPTAPPTLSGDTTVGQTLTASHATWSDRPTSYKDSWERCDAAGNSCTTIANAVGQSYTLTSAEAGATVRVQESATNDAGTGGPATSAATGVVQAGGGPPTKPANNSLPVISGAPTVGRALSTSAGTWSGTPPLTYTYQWQLCDPACANIAGATAGTYVPTGSAVGDRVRSLVTASNSLGAVSVASSQVGPVRPSGQMVGAALSSILVPKGKGARIGAVLRTGGYTFTFNAPSGGTLTVRWYFVFNVARVTRHGAVKTKLLGAARASFAKAGAAKVRLRLTAPGRSLLAHARSLKLVSKAGFTPAGAVAVTMTRPFVLVR